MILIFLYGLPGVGKLTVAMELGKLTGFKIFHNHLAVDLVGSVFEFGSHAFVELREMIWLSVFSQAVEARLSGLIFTFALDRTVSLDFIGKVRNVIEGDGGKVFFVELKCAQPELEIRLAQPSRRRFAKLNDVKQFRELSDAGAFVDPGIPDNKLTMDTTDLSASETARLIVDSLKLE